MNDDVAVSHFRAGYASLSPAQQAALGAMCHTGDWSAAAALLYRSEETVKNHLMAAYRALGLRGYTGKRARACYLLGRLHGASLTPVTKLTDT